MLSTPFPRQIICTALNNQAGGNDKIRQRMASPVKAVIG